MSPGPGPENLSTKFPLSPLMFKIKLEASNKDLYLLKTSVRRPYCHPLQMPLPSLKWPKNSQHPFSLRQLGSLLQKEKGDRKAP
jgi:hypothetical protein